MYIRQAAGREVARRERGLLPLVSVGKPPAISTQGRRRGLAGPAKRPCRVLPAPPHQLRPDARLPSDGPQRAPLPTDVAAECRTARSEVCSTFAGGSGD